MSHEKISPFDPQDALDAYLIVSPLLKSISSEIPCSLPSKTGSLGSDPGSFIRYRELWRWTERLLRRSIFLAAGLNDLENQDSPIWVLFDNHRSCSAHWPATFRPQFRSTVLALHLRALIVRSRISKPPRWISIARSIIQEYRTLLSISTQFPRAGERNEKVEDFIDLCVAVWEADGAFGEDAGWVVDVGSNYYGYSLQLLTFNYLADTLVGDSLDIQFLPNLPSHGPCTLCIRGSRTRQKDVASVRASCQ